MAPSMAASINPQGTATTVGRAVPIAFALAFVGVLLVAYTFVRLTQRFHHSGSVYGFVGATLGPRAGVISGWALTGTYTFYAVVTSMAGGRFAANFLNAIGVWKNPPTWSGFLLGAIGMVLVWWLAITPARGGTRVLLAAEAITVLLILIVIVIVFAKLAGHSAAARARRGLVGVQPARPASRCPRSSSAWCSASCPSPGSRPRPPWARRPSGPAATSRGPSSAWPSSAASTSSWSPRSR